VRATSPGVTVRRHWGAFRTPWVVRKLRKSASTRAPLPDAYTYNGSSADADRWARALIAETDSFGHSLTGMALTAPRRTRDRPGLSDLADVPSSVDTGGGGGGDWLAGADEYGLVIIGAIVVLIAAAIAVPLGLIAIEIVLTLGLAVAGIVLRLARVKPWTVLVLRNRIVVAVVAVKGWRTSRAVIAALRQHAT
jgi:hypothetical protein